MRDKNNQDNIINSSVFLSGYLARLERLELPTRCLEGSCSIQLSYRRASNVFYFNENCPFQSPPPAKKRVGEIGFEPTTSCSQGRRANQAAPLPVNFHSDERIARKLELISYPG